MPRIAQDEAAKRRAQAVDQWTVDALTAYKENAATICETRGLLKGLDPAKSQAVIATFRGKSQAVIIALNRRMAARLQNSVHSTDPFAE